MCNTTPWFTGEDNPCFRQGEAVTARGVGFPFLLFTERGRVLLRSAWLQRPSYMSTDWSAGSQTASSCTHSGFLYFFLGFLFAFSLSLSLGFVPYTVSDCIRLYPCFHLTPPLFPIQLSLTISPSVRGLMWDCKWSSFTTISGFQGSICVAQYQAGHSAPLRREREGKWNFSHINTAHRPL